MSKEEARKKTVQEIYENLMLKDLGFKYFKAKNYFERKSNGFSFTIGFNSSRVNILENTNILIVTAGVSHEKFAEWQKDKLGRYPSGLIGSGKIKNLFTPGPPYIDFDIQENEAKRQEVIAEISSILKSNVFDFFEICIDKNRIIENVNLPCFSISSIIQYFKFIGNEQDISIFFEKKAESFSEIKDQINYYSDRLKHTPSGTSFPETFTDASKLSALQIAETMIRIGN